MKNISAGKNILYTALGMLLVLPLALVCPGFSADQKTQTQSWPGTVESRKALLAETLDGIHIVPGAWRPHFPWEQIAWIKPPWDTHDYVWMDFPEAVFTDKGVQFLSHINPRIAQPSPDLPAVPWKKIPGGLAFERFLATGVTFGGSLVAKDDSTVALTLYIHNRTEKLLTRVRFQTCAFLRHVKEFAAFTTGNKYVHLPEKGWTAYEEAGQLEKGEGQYRMKWDGENVADRPVMISVSGSGEEGAPRRMIAMTWEKDTYMLFGNPRHPCMHADPKVPDIPPGETATVHGRLIFFEGTMDELWAQHFSHKN